MQKKSRKRLSRVLIPLAIAVVVVVLWELVISNDDNLQRFNGWVEGLTGWQPGLDAAPTSILPRPSVILKALLVTPRNEKGGLAYFWKHTSATLSAAALGFLIGNLFAILTATAFLYIKSLERALMPVALALRSIPLVAITPLLLRIRFSIADLEVVQTSPFLDAIFGTDLVMKLIIVVVICYFPTLVNVARGLVSVESSALELMHTLRASRWQAYWKLRVPAALPLTFSALKVASSAAVLGAVVAEWLSSSTGLGYVIYRSHAEQAEPKVWMAMTISCLMAIASFTLINVLQRFAIPWHRSVVHLRGALDGEAEA
jgi:NitT/TauT family transport system permease protein